jgi:hypothetical protein
MTSVVTIAGVAGAIVGIVDRVKSVDRARMASGRKARRSTNSAFRPRHRQI